MNKMQARRKVSAVFSGFLMLAFLGSVLYADVTLTDQGLIRGKQKKLEKMQKRIKNNAWSASSDIRTQGLVAPMATGFASLIDNDDVKWFINTNITFSTTSSGSGAMSEASYITAVMASTLHGGAVSASLNDAFDGYNTLAVSLTGATGQPRTGDSAYILYLKNGPPAVDPDSGGREYAFPVQTGAGFQMWRKVFVPADDSFGRWLNFVKNTGATPLSINVLISNNLGSDANTITTGSSNGNNTAETTDTWIGTMQNFSGTTSPDPREAHILQGTGSVPVPLSNVYFAPGEDNPYWGYTLTIPAGETYCIMNFCVLKPTIAAAATAAGTMAALTNTHALDFMSAEEKAQVKNFNPTTQLWLTVKSSAGGRTHPSGSAQYEAGSTVRIQATPDPGYHLINWSWDASGTSNPLNFRMNKDSVVWANFFNTPPTVQITYPADGSVVNGPSTVTATAADDTAVAKVEFFVDGALRATDTTAPYAFDWNSLAESLGSHTLKAVATDAAGAAGSHQITVNVQNVTLAMTGLRRVEQAWITQRDYAALTIHVSNPGSAAIQKYVLYRKAGTGAYQSVKELTTAEVGTGMTYNDGPLTKGVSYTYKLTAFIGGAEIAVSNEVAI
jgi:hypothetical protein